MDTVRDEIDFDNNEKNPVCMGGDETESQSKDQTGCFLLISQPEINALKVGGLKSELMKMGIMLDNGKNKPALKWMLEKAMIEKNKNVTNSESNKKALSGFPESTMWGSLSPPKEVIA